MINEKKIDIIVNLISKLQLILAVSLRKLKKDSNIVWKKSVSVVYTPRLRIKSLIAPIPKDLVKIVAKIVIPETVVIDEIEVITLKVNKNYFH